MFAFTGNWFKDYRFAYIYQFVSGALSECQAVWNQIMTNILFVLIWVQTVCIGYQQMTKVATSKEKVDGGHTNMTNLQLK